MNFVGKFDAKLQVDGSGTHPDAHHHVDSISAHAPAGAIIVPDADLLFNGDFKRSGVDLILSRNDHEWVVEDYFKGEKRVALASPDGAHLTGDIINAMAGHVEYAQADGNAGAGKVIGHVTKLVGTATAIRNGVSIILNQGDNVEKGDVVQSGSSSTLGVTFIDGTVFGLSSNARMVLNEMVYDPKGSDNSTLFSLVSGTISFVAGQTAKHGDMKIDTPVATMGIRGTAVLVEIDFDVPGQNGKPEARFQVVMEPDGTIGSYILYDKNTFAPMALVDKAGQQVHISENNVSFSDSPLSPELQKLITDVFTLKFTTNPQTFTHFADTLIPQSFPLAPLPNGAVPTATIHLVTLSTVLNATPSAPAVPSPIPHINQPPVVTTVDSSVIERASLSGSSAIDSTSGTISFGDINLGDRPTAKATISSFTYQNAQHQDIAASVQELADIHALEDIPLVVVQAPGNTYFGTATWTLNVPDKAFDFLGAGDTLTLTYKAEVDSNYSGGSIPGFANFTITITGTNDVPVITTGPEKVAFVSVGTGTTGPNLPPTGPTSNKFTFKDPDMTDTHTVSAGLTNATLSGNGVPTLDMQALEAKFPRPMGVFEHALSTAVTTDSFGTGTGTITWTLADISAYYADIVPAGETLKLTYTVTVKDSQGATSSQKVIVTITGSAPPAVVWVETTKDALTDPAPGDWNGAHNWETGTVPTASDDVIIITNQLQGQTPFYPVTIKAGGAAAFAHSVTMNDYGTLFTNSPTLINQNTLTVGAGGISLSADAILENFGTLSVGGLAEILQQASLQNSGTIKLLAGGDFKDKSSITNSDKIEISGGTLDVEVAVANAGGTIQVDSGATLQLNGASIDGGTVTGSGKIDVTGDSKIDSGATLNNGAATVESGVTLTLDGMTVNATTITDKGTIVLDDTVKLTGGATIEGASGSALGSITNNGTLEVAGSAELLNDTLTNTSGIIQVDDSQTLKLNGTTINGGTINDFSGLVGGTIDVTGDSKIDSGATLNDGAVTVESGVTLTLDGMTANATTITDKGTIVLDGTVKLTGGATIEGVSGSALGSITNDGTLEVAGAAELLNDTLTNTSGIIQVDDSQTLTLNGTEIIGGIINDFSGLVGGKIDVTGDSKIDSGATLNKGFVTVESGVTLTLDGMTANATTITDKGTIVLDDTVKLTGGATIEGASGSALGSITNNGTLEVAGSAELLNDTLTNTSGIIQVDDSQTLKLNGTTINGGTINDFSGLVGGTIDVTGDSKIDSGATLNDGAVTVESGVTLTLDGMTVNATTITDKGTIVLDDTVKLTGGATIEGASGSALGSITNNGTLEVAGSAELLNDTLTNTSGIIQVDDSQTLKLNGTTINGGTINDFSGLVGGTIDVTGDSKIDSGATLNDGAVTVESGVTLTLDGMTVNATTITDKGTIVLDGTVKLTGGATIEGASASALGAITNNGTLEVAGAAELLNDTLTNTSGIIQVDDSQTLTLNGTEIIGGIINDFSGLVGGKIDVTGDSKIDSGATLNKGFVTVESGVTLTLDGMTANATTITDKGTIVLDDTVKLTGGATIEGVSASALGSITNNGTLEVAGAAELLNDTLTNTSGIIQVDDSQTLTLNGTEIIGGIVNDFSGLLGGKIDVTGASTIAGTGTAAEANLNGAGAGSTVQLDAALTLDYVKLNGITLENGPLTIKDTVEVAGAVTLLNDIVTNTGATLQVDDGITLKLNGTTINGGTINDFSGLVGGTIDVTGDSKIAGTGTAAEANLNGAGAGSTVQLDAALTLDYVKLNDITLENGPLTIKDTVEVAGAVTLLNDIVTNTGATLQVDDGITLKLNGTTINGGTINDFSGLLGGKIDVTGDSKIAGTGTAAEASLNGAGAGSTVQLDAALTLDYVKLNDITLENGPLTIKDTVEVAGAVTLLNDTVTNTGATLQVDDGITLKLNGTTINGGTINDFSGLLGGKIDVTGASTIAGTGTAAEANLNGAGAGSTVQLDAALTLDYVKLNDITLENGPLTIKDTVEVAGAVTLLNDIVTNTGATLQVDDGITLKLNGTTINGGTINDFSGLVGGTIDVTGASTIAGTGTAAEANLNGAGAGSTVQLDAALTLDYVKLNDITLKNGPLTIKDTVEVAGAVTLLNDIVTNTGATLQVDDGITLKLNGTTINGGTINDFSGLLGGKIDVTGDSKIDDGATLNDGAVTVESGVTLTLDNMTVNGTVFNDLVTGGTIQIDGGDTLTFNGSTIDGGTLNIVGELDSTGTSFITGATIINSSHIDIVSGILTIDPTPVTNTGMIEVKGDATLVLSDEIITNTDGTTKGVIQVDADPTHTATLDLEGSTINGGTVTIAGVLDSTGDSFITGADITNTGTIDVTSGTLTIDATSILNNTGTLETNGGNLIIDTAFAGSLEIKGAAALELGSANAYSQVTVTFEPEATGTLKLDHSKTFSGTVAGLDDNTIDLADIVYGSNPTVSYAGNASGGILSVFAGGVDVSNIKLTGDYLGVHWTFTDDGSSQHGTDVMEVPGAVAGLDPNGNATQGVALTASITDGGQTVSAATYDWQVSHDGGKTWVDANGTNGLSSYTPVEADEGQLLRVALSFVDHSGEPEKSFVSAGVVQESLTDDLVATLDSQTAKQGVTMHVLGVTDGGITVTTGLTYAWQDSSDNGLTWVTVGAQPSYTPGESDEGKLMQLVVTYADASGSESSTYSLGMPNDLSATLDSTTAQQGLAIHVTGVKDGGGNVSSGVSYAWQVSSDDGQHWTTVGTHSSFTPIAADAGETLQVIVTYVDSEENESATYSLGTVAPANEWLGGNHNWQTAGQWATSGVPVSSDNAVIDASGFYTVKIDQAAVAHSLVVNDLGAAVEILAGNTLTLGGNATIEAGILQIDSGATLKDIAASATITGAFIDNGTVEAAGGTLEVASAISFGAGKFKIDAGATLQLDHADTLKVAFSGAGELILKDPTHFTGIISDGGGSLTSADVVDVAGFDTGASVSYSGFKSGGIVTITETGHTAVNLIVGANSTHWSAPVTDGHGGILIHDPPADTSGQDLGSVVMHDPAPAASGTIIASGPNQILTGNAASDTFAFNFTGVGHTTVTDFHPATDTLQLSSQLFADLEAALNATHDDGHGNTVVALDGHDTITLNGILKAQLHASDFHFV